MLIKKIVRTVKQRLDFLLRNRSLSFSERVQIVAHAHIYETHVAHRLLLKRLESDPSGERYFRVGGHSIYFAPDYPIENQEFFLFGITQVLTETFLLPRFFSKNVYIRPGDVVLDIGANIGTTALLFSELVGPHGQVWAIEPVAHEVLRKNLTSNHIDNVSVIPAGVAEHDGDATIYLSDFCLDSTLVQHQDKEDYYSNTRTIDIFSLDTLVEQTGLERIDFIKIDIEGAEELALKGAQRLIERFRPQWSISSYHL